MNRNDTPERSGDITNSGLAATPPPNPDDRTRFILSIVVATVVLGLAVATVVQPSAGPVFKELQPLLTLVLGYFFGREVHRLR